MIDSSLELSVIVPTVRGLGSMRACLDAIIPQLEGANAELIVADGSDCPDQLTDQVTRDRLLWQRMPGLGIFELRSRALQLARGRIIAYTEDHCVAAPDWLAAMLSAHALKPEALII